MIVVWANALPTLRGGQPSQALRCAIQGGCTALCPLGSVLAAVPASPVDVETSSDACASSDGPATRSVGGDDEVVWAWMALAAPSTATTPRIAVRITMVIDPSNRSGSRQA